MIVVIGAGPAGLAAAWALDRSGHDVVVLDRAAAVGATAASHTVSGVRVDLGSHRLDPAMREPVRAVIDGLVDLHARQRRDRIRLGDRWLPLPLTTAGLVRRLPASVAARTALDAAVRPFRSPRSDSLAGIARAEVGTTMWRRLHGPYAWKLWDTDPRRLAGESARHLLSAEQPLRPPFRVRRRPPTLLYPGRGFGALSEAMASALPDVRLGTKVTALMEQPDRVIVGLADGRILTASHVVSTLPVGVTATWLGLAEPAAVQVRHRAVVLVYLTLDRRPYTTFDTHHLPERHLLATRISEPTNHRQSPDDPTDRTVLCAEIPCWSGDATWRASDDDLGLRIADDLVRCGLPDPCPVAVDTVRLPSVHPVMTPQAVDALDHAHRAVAGSRRVTALGGEGLCTSQDTHRLIDMGLQAARCVDSHDSFDGPDTLV